MTRQTRRRVRRKTLEFPELTRFQELCLASGGFFHLAFNSLDEMQRAYSQHRERILSEWITSRPGTRPFAEWLFYLVPEHGERRVLPGAPPAWPKRLGLLHTHTIPPIQEDELTYLQRHNLLTPGERSA